MSDEPETPEEEEEPEEEPENVTLEVQDGVLGGGSSTPGEE